MADRPHDPEAPPHDGGGALGVGVFRRAAELLALTAFAIAQPVLDVTGRAPDFFLYRRANTNEMRLFVALVILLPPLALWTVELAVGVVNRKAANVLHLGFVTALVASIVVQVGKKAGLFTGVPLAVLGVLAGAALTVLLARTKAFRDFLAYASPAPLVFGLLFALTSPSGALVRGAEIDRGDARIIGNRPPVVYLFLDEFPLRTLLDDKGQIDARTYPNFERLRKMSTWYPNATGVSGFTPFAAPAMLRGRFPERINGQGGPAASYINYPETLFTLLAGNYQMRAYETIGELCPPGFCEGVREGRDVGMRALSRDTIDLTTEIVSPYKVDKNETEQFVESGIGAARDLAEGKEAPGAMDKFGEVAKNQPTRLGPFLEDLRPQDRPNLHFMHFLLPHSPWRYLPSGNEYGQPGTKFPPDRPDPNKPDKTTNNDPLVTAVGKQRLVLQTVYLDTLLGTMLDRMEQTGLLSQALLIVTADHGTGIAPSVKARQLDDTNAPDLAWVPLFVKTPGQTQPKTDDRNAMGIDVVPTIADVLDVEIPWEVEGRSLLGPARTEERKTFFDAPGVPEYIDPAKWQDQLELGYAAEVLHPERGREGLFMIGEHAGLVGKKVSDLTVGSPSPVTADLDQRITLDAVDPATGKVPAMIWGTLDKPAAKDSTWLVASVNGTIAGGIAAVPTDGTWRFLGLVDDTYFSAGKAEIVLYAVEGDTLHPLTLVP